MEVFLSNLPPDLTDASMTSHLEPIMQKLSIEFYHCEKPKRKKTGHVTFINKEDGQRFLDCHGEIPLPLRAGLGVKQQHSQGPGQPRESSQSNARQSPGDGQGGRVHAPSQPRLHLMGKKVFCRPSDRPPDKFVLKSIPNMVKARKRRAQAAEHEPAPVTLETLAVDCGHFAFVGDKLTFIAEWSQQDFGLAKFTKRGLTVKIPSSGAEIRIDHRQIYELLWSHDGSIALTLVSVPTFQAIPKDDIVKQLRDSFTTLGIGPAQAQQRPEQRPRLVAVDKDHAKISNFCLTYHIKTRTTDLGGEMCRLAEWNVVHVNRYEIPFMRPQAAQFLPFDSAVSAFRDWLGPVATRNALPFGIMFNLQALIYNCYLHPAVVTVLGRKLEALFTKTRQSDPGARDPVSVEAMKKLFTRIPYPTPFDIETRWFQVDGLLEGLIVAENEVRREADMRLTMMNTANSTAVYRVVITPGRITLHGPELEAGNRVLRKYPAHQDYFIRAQLCDEDGQDLFFNPRISLDVIYSRFKSVLDRGIAIGGRVYKFLGFSHSSLRSHTAWLVAPFVFEGQLFSRNYIVTGLGEFRHIKSPARQAARIGQAFSETPFAISLDEEAIFVDQIPDVSRNTQGIERVFSDGVGTISEEASQAIWKHLPRKKNAPTAYQIRFAGVKGMLSLDVNLPGKRFCIRPSMDKFPSKDDSMLEICDMASRPIPMVLNRSLIQILEDMGVPDDWFLRHQELELKNLRGITASAHNTARFIKRQSVGDGIGLERLIRHVDRMGLDYRTDQFLRNAVEAVVLRELRLLKHKARIPIPKGITLFGIMDETGYLKEGQVFVSFDPIPGQHHHGPHNQPVLVTRSPALHPGDVQVAQNVVPPNGHPLTALSNCIAFSQHGARDLPSQLSGGDLDGDLFHVIWDEEIVDCVRSFPPADYPRVPPRELDRNVETTDIINFFVDFMKTDHLGVIATRHLILADRLDQGTRAPDCLKLAQLASAAVDFSKTGIPVELTELPKGSPCRPDFLTPGPHTYIHKRSEIDMDQEMTYEDDSDEETQGSRYKYYESEKILGYLYRGVDEHKIWYHDIKRVLPTHGPNFWEEFTLAVKQRCFNIGEIQWNHRMDAARNIRHVYEDMISDATVQFSEYPMRPLSELEVFVGFIINRHGSHTKRQRDASHKLRDEFERISSEIMKQIRKPRIEGGYTSELDGIEMSMACLHVGCMPDFQPGYSNRMSNFVSFKVVAGAAVLRELSNLESGMSSIQQGGGYLGVNGRTRIL